MYTAWCIAAAPEKQSSVANPIFYVPIPSQRAGLDSLEQNHLAQVTYIYECELLPMCLEFQRPLDK